MLSARRTAATPSPLELNTTGLIVLQSTSFCNIDCSYCYLPNRHLKNVMSLDDVELFLGKLFEFPTIRNDLTLLWHAGEPCVLPPDYYSRAIDTIERIKPPWLNISYSILTNGTLLNENWIALLRERKIHIGLSVDGPKEIHDSRRLSRSGRGTFDKAANTMRLLNRENIPFYVLSVLSGESLDKAEAYAEFCAEYDVASIGFNIDEIESVNKVSSFSREDSANHYRSFLVDFLLHAEERSPKLKAVREIFSMMERIRSMTGGSLSKSIVNEQTDPFRIISISTDGMISTFSPELLTSSHELYSNFYFGNLRTHSFWDVLENPQFQRVFSDIEVGVEACKQDCGYFNVCGGGAPVNKLFEKSSLKISETMYCKITQKAVADLCLDCLLEPSDDR